MVKYIQHSSELRSEEVLSKSDASGEQQERFGEMSGCSLGDAFYSGCSAMDQLGTFMRNVQVLLEAASYIESAEKSSGKCEHGYASAYPETQMAHQHKHRKFKSRKVDNMHNRSAHNELEKNRNLKRWTGGVSTNWRPWKGSRGTCRGSWLCCSLMERGRGSARTASAPAWTPIAPSLTEKFPRKLKWTWKAPSSPMEKWTMSAPVVQATWTTTAAGRARPATRATPPAA
ncbi:uncharacterized protein LOC105927284 isoform X2 [Fundulus heteroclitus]|uniref:uncharacterized protein LOC105927284 isoform X2 n=1 Tax=Fundulus heteroclitus TaxID=8078 RepID=UPI00165A273C|nr:uncharacterized protein LOC105927284 isoform X2 [Fundulus heteroclitus]